MYDDMEPLATPAELSAFPGAPFTAQAIAAVGNQVRGACGWHIAPKLTETLVLDGSGGPDLFLPSLAVESISEVRIYSRGALEVATGWDARTGWNRIGVLHRPAGWPREFRSVEVDIVHGYDKCPTELLRYIAVRTEARVIQESLGSHSVTLDSGDAWGVDAALAPYKLGHTP